LAVNNVCELVLIVVLYFSAVHLGGGIWGVLAAPIFNKDTGIFYAADEHSFRLFGWNLLGLLAIMPGPFYSLSFFSSLCASLKYSASAKR